VDLESLSADLEPLNADLEPLSADLETLNADLETLNADSGSLIPDPGSLIPDPTSPVVSPPRVHTPAPFSVWAKKETAKPTAVGDLADGGFEGLFAAAIPADVASVAYATGVRIRRVRVRVAKDAHPALHAAMARGRRMIAGLGGSDAPA
jgi:hypothetical protein